MIVAEAYDLGVNIAAFVQHMDLTDVANTSQRSDRLYCQSNQLADIATLLNGIYLVELLTISA